MSSKKPSDEDFILAAREEILDRARKSLLAFTFATKPDYSVNWHHKALCKKLDQFVRGEIQFLMIFLPPRHGKSELVSRRLPAFIHGLYPDYNIMTASYSDSLATDMCADVQRIIDSPEYAEVFPETKIVPSNQKHPIYSRNSSEHQILGREGKYIAQGVGGSFTGRGTNFVLIDDPIKGREAADSLAFREKLWNFYNNDLFSRLETDLKTGRKGQVLVTQTRWHEDDLSGRLLELAAKDKNSVQWEVVNYPAIKQTDEDPSDPRQVGEALWPIKYDLNKLNEIRASIGQRAWSSLYQQNPTPTEGALFQRDMFEFGDTPGEFDYTFIMADTAYTEKKESDFTVFTAFGVSGERLCITDVFRRQMKASDVENAAIQFISKHQRYSFRGAYIEPKGHGIYLNQTLPRRGITIPPESMIKSFFSDRNKDKVERANNAVPWLGNKKVTISNAVNSKEDLLAEILGFPKARHDDFVDTVIDGIKFAFARENSLLDIL